MTENAPDSWPRSPDDRVRTGRRALRVLAGAALLAASSLGVTAALAQEDDELEPVDSSVCADCHEESEHGSAFADDVSHSIHRELECQSCHQDKLTVPHREDGDFAVGCEGCRTCHDRESAEYQGHGRAKIHTCEDMPQCTDCHGDHDVLPSSAKLSRTHPTNLPATCGRCHENLDITTKYDILIDNPIEIYQSSVHGRATRGGVYVAATCNDCHSTGGSAHRIYGPGHPDSSINHFNIPKTCGQCHKGVEGDFWEGIHGQLVTRGETDAPVCTHCHGEHGIISPDDPLSPVSRSRVAEQTCSPCHESAVLNEKYGLPSGRLTTFIDSYHGLKSKAGDTHVANCASCHGVHRILPSSDRTSTVNPANLRQTCGECHPGISGEMAKRPIHGIGGEGLRTAAADIVEKIYRVALVVIIGLMVLHWVIDLGRHLRDMMRKTPQIRRMSVDELWQHALLALSFIVLVISGFALRFSDGWVARLFFGWEGGFEIRGIVHRVAAVLFVLTVLWHAVFILATRRGRQFVHDMMPRRRDFEFFVRKILHNLGLGEKMECIQRFSYVEKAEYWALVWGTVVMLITGFLLWFDNWFIQFLPKGVLDVALVIHYWEAWLAALAVLVWHAYSTIFHPAVYPMNPSWITGMMPEDMYRREHPGHLEAARQETQEYVEEQMARLAWRKASTAEEQPPHDPDEEPPNGPDQEDAGTA